MNILAHMSWPINPSSINWDALNGLEYAAIATGFAISISALVVVIMTLIFAVKEKMSFMALMDKDHRRVLWLTLMSVIIFGLPLIACMIQADNEKMIGVNVQDVATEQVYRLAVATVGRHGRKWIEEDGTVVYRLIGEPTTLGISKDKKSHYRLVASDSVLTTLNTYDLPREFPVKVAEDQIEILVPFTLEDIDTGELRQFKIIETREVRYQDLKLQNRALEGGDDNVQEDR